MAGSILKVNWVDCEKRASLAQVDASVFCAGAAAGALPVADGWIARFGFRESGITGLTDCEGVCAKVDVHNNAVTKAKNRPLKQKLRLHTIEIVVVFFIFDTSSII
ncbi:MAG: hypothetical protein EBY29_12415 [Planctomycetes bacterium]|nr:hypothetical protein [Planctomycetota bacterium]